MDPRPIQRVAPTQPQPAGAPSTRPSGNSTDFARELVDALRGRGGTAASSAARSGAGDSAAENQPEKIDLSTVDPFGFGSDGSISTDAIAARTEQLQAQFTARLDALFAAAAVDTSVPIELRADTFGRVRVVGDHPDTAKIEALFEDSFELQQTFTRLSSARSLLRAAEQHQAFAAAYAEDPHGAVTRFGHLFNATTPEADFRLTFAEDEWSTRFE